MIPKQVADRLRTGENPIDTCQVQLYVNVVNPKCQKHQRAKFSRAESANWFLFRELRPATRYQVDLTGTPEQVYMIYVEHTHYQVDLTGGPVQAYLSGLPDSEWPGQRNFIYFGRHFSL
jgi:hypothetical protein